MASVFHTTVAFLFLTIVLLQSSPSTCDILSPMLSPLFDDLCKEVECGKGSCKASGSNNSFIGSYVCECEPGWKQFRFDKDDDLKFMPCVIPNCTLDYSCDKGHAPAPEKQKQYNSSSIFDPCNWVDCGGGICNKTSLFTHTCECNEGYNNLLNVTVFPCYRECALGMDCLNLGIGVSNGSSSSSSPPGSADNRASSDSSGFYNWLIVVAISLSLLLLW